MIAVDSTGQATVTDLITLDVMKARLTAVAEARPEHIGVGENGACDYFFDGAPSCIVGHAFEAEFRALGKDVDTIGGDVYELASDEILPLTEAAMNYAGQVQSLQDSEVPWGEAIRRVEAESFRDYEDTRLVVDRDYED